jgi:hypothetical protein
MFERLLPCSLPIVIMASVGMMSFSPTHCRGATSNEQFCNLAMGELADSLLDRIELKQGEAIQLAPIEDRFGEELRRQLAERLHHIGVVVYLGVDAAPSGRIMTTAVKDLMLTYQREGGGMFSRGKIKRTFSAMVTGTLQWNDGQLAQVVSIPRYVKSDILSSREALQARGGDGFLTPEIPLSFQQRILEPSFVVVITGALVYLFFASR